jgi:deoxyribose-phosphate aldolase
MIGSLIDHTLLKPDATSEDVRKLCAEAVQHNFASVCINSSFVVLAASLLAGSVTKPICVVGFPLGAMSSTAKAFEAKEAVLAGAQEIDMVIKIGALKEGSFSLVYEDISQVVQAAKPYPVKVILETALLTEEEKVFSCVISKAAGAAFVKTCTGFSGGKATEEDIKLMRRVVGADFGVKASGGIRTYEDAAKMIAAGANRIGTSAGVAIALGEEAGGRIAVDDGPQNY